MSATMNKHHHTIGKGLIPSMVIQVLGCPHSWWHPSCWWSKFILLNHRTLLGSSLKQYVLDELLIPEWKIEHGFPIDKPPSKEGPWLRQEDGCYQMHLAAKWGLFLHLVSLFWAGKHWNVCLKFGWNSHWPHSVFFSSDWNRKWMVPSLVPSFRGGSATAPASQFSGARQSTQELRNWVIHHDSSIRAAMGQNSTIFNTPKNHRFREIAIET